MSAGVMGIEASPQRLTSRRTGPSNRHRRRHRRVMFIALQAEITRLDQLQPLRLVLAGRGECRHAVTDYQLGCLQRLALELLVEHLQVVFIDVGIANEVGEPARGVTRQATEQRQQRRAFGEVERRAQAVPPTLFLHNKP